MRTSECAESPRRSGLAAVAAQAQAVLRAWRGRHETRMAIRQLKSMDDRELKDMGIQRPQIEFLVRGHAEP